MTAPAIASSLTKLRNYNNCLLQPYFGQVSNFPNNWLNMIGTFSNVIHVDIKMEIIVELIGIKLLQANELQDFEKSIYINNENVPTIAELCGFDKENFKKFQFATGFSGHKIIGLFIFKNVST